MYIFRTIPVYTMSVTPLDQPLQTVIFAMTLQGHPEQVLAVGRGAHLLKETLG